MNPQCGLHKAVVLKLDYTLESLGELKKILMPGSELIGIMCSLGSGIFRIVEEKETNL